MQKRIAWLILLVSAFSISALLAASTAALQEQPARQERVLEDLIPKHIPIKIKLRKKKEAFKDLENDLWVRDFELEVTNTGEKPIYSLYLMLLLPEMKVFPGYNSMIPLAFGKEGKVTDRAEPNDVSIKPGETYVLVIHEGVVKAWEMNPRLGWPRLEKIQVQFQLLSFGDGTGYAGSDGTALPRKL